MKSPLHHLKHPERLFEHFHNNVHHALVIFALAITGMLRGASNILTPTSANWQWWGFLTSDFWEQNPSNENIAYTLFGDGTPGDTAYTRLRDTSCTPTNVVRLTGNYVWGTLSANTIYLLSGNYTFTTAINMGSCSAFLGVGNTMIKPYNASANAIFRATGKNNIIIDNINIDRSWTQGVGISFDYPQNVSVNNVRINNNGGGYGIRITQWINVLINDSSFFRNWDWVYITTGSSNITINNVIAFSNNSAGIAIRGDYITVNNSQAFNNGVWIYLHNYWWPSTWHVIVNNSLSYNNTVGFSVGGYSTYYLHDVKIYNNGAWIMNYGWLEYYWYLDMFNNGYLTWGSEDITAWSVPILNRPTWELNTWDQTFSYDRFTNPQNSSGQFLLTWTSWIWTRTLINGRTWAFPTVRLPMRYIFWGNIIKQAIPVFYSGADVQEYGNDGADYTITKYIAEPESSLPATQQTLVNQYFWPDSVYTQNRATNGCSLSAFQVKTLNPATFTSVYNFEDHTIYILTGGDYKSTLTSWSGWFVFNGNCIALIGNSNTRFTKSSGISSILYASNKRNIIIDTIKVDGLYFSLYGTTQTYWPTPVAIKLDGASNNSTINNAQVYNASLYGIYLGLGSHHNTIVNAQIFNNWSAGIHLYYSSNYNVINNVQTYNNGSYGIWFANGSRRNTINNFQSYNNAVWMFWDLTTQENVINRAAIYNNSTAGVYFKNSSNNMLNDVSIFNNTIGIKTLYSSMGNRFYWELKLFDNTWGNLDGTTGNDTYLSAGDAGLFPYGGAITTGTNMASCLYATNPTLSGNWATLLNSNCNNIWYTVSFRSWYNTYVNYAFGLNMYKQKIPVKYDTTNMLIQMSSQYDSTKYIGEISAIRDTTPENVNFISSGAAQLNTRYTTNIYTAGVINIAVPITLSLTPNVSGHLIISWVVGGLTWTINNGDILQISLLTRTGYNETITGTITIWSVTTGFVITTRWLNQLPTTWSFAFTNLSYVPLNTFTWSSTIISGIETGVLASITFSPTTTSGRLEIYSWTTFISSGTTGFVAYSWYQVNVVAQSSSGYSTTITGYVTIGLGTGTFTITTKWSDSVAPTAPVLTYPLTGEDIFFVIFKWDASIDTGAGIEWYMYQIASDTYFTHIINTGFITTSTGIEGSPNTGFDAISRTYYWRMQAKDRDGNYSARSNTGRFDIVDFNDRDFTNKDDANLVTYYDSNEITLEGINTGSTVLATVDANGTLYVNGNEEGTGALVQNGDDLFVSVKSSSRYDKTITSVLTIANRKLEFDVTTKQESDSACTLSAEEETTIQSIFDSLVINYSWDADKYDEFLNTMKSMLADQIDFTNDCNLQYLEDLINVEINGGWVINTATYIASNCKEYTVSYDSTRMAYTSPVFKTATFFANRDSLNRYIDSKNPGDCHINTYGASSWAFTNTDPSKHIAPNGKVYMITSGSQGYTSDDFATKKYFSTLAALRSFIDGRNVPQDIWNHQVDTTFTPQTYTAPNGKSYTIYRTDRWYMSYKLLKVRYFFTLADIQYFISSNNRR